MKDRSAHLTRITKHTGPLKRLQFNPYRTELLASAGSKGELYLNDLSEASKTFRLGTAVARADDFDALDWNKKVAHILVTGSSGGFATVWDARAKKESLTLNNLGRKAISAIAWDPDNSTKLVTGTSWDQDPVILLWDLRNSNAPEKTFKGHEQGILSLAWSAQDPSLLLSCGKDNRTICWNARTGEAFGEFPIVTNWTFETQWNPRQPGILATASFDGKIGVQTIQNTNQDASQTAAAPVDDADFFAQAGSQPQGAAFSLSQAPKWLERPVGAVFGFGGQLVRFSNDATTRQPKLQISTYVADETLGDAAQKFEETLQKGDYATFCEAKIAEAKTEEEKADWTVIETLISGSRTGLRDYLGFAPAVKEEVNGELKEVKTNGDAGGDDEAFFGGDSTDDNFLSTLASTKGARTNNPFKIYTGSESDADKQITKALMLGSFEEAVNVCLKEDRISDAFMIAICGGQKCIDKVQSAYFKQKSSDGPNYLRLLASVVGKNLWDVVYNADLAGWKEVLATLCTFADEKEFPDLCESLGDRLEESLQDGESGVSRKDASFCYLAGSKLEKVVTIWSAELAEQEKAALQSPEADSAFSVHAKALQDFIEKVTVFREVTKFQDADATKSEGWKLEGLYKMYAEYAEILASNGKMSLASRYLDLVPESFAPAVAAKGRVKQRAAPKAAAAVTSASAGIQPRGSSLPQRGQRVVATPAAATSSPYAPAAFGAPIAPVATPAQTSYQPSGGQSSYAPPSQSSYAPQGQSSYAPSSYQPPQNSSYAPQAGYQPSAPTSNPYAAPNAFQPQNTFGGGIAPPPRNSSASPAPAPAATNKNLAQWNDTPDFGNQPRPSRRGTPAFGQPGANPYAPQGNVAAPPPTSFSPPAAKPLAPPPKAGAPRVMSPPTVGHVQQQDSRPSSSAASAYAPSAPSGLGQSYTSPPPAQQGLGSSFGAPPSIPRGASPYNPPPSSSAAPTNSRYAPAPGTAPSPAPGYGGGPPPGARQVAPPPGAGQYGAPGGGYGAAPSPYGQPPSAMGGAGGYGAPPNMAKATPPPPAAPAPPPKGPAHVGGPPPQRAGSNHRHQGKF